MKPIAEAGFSGLDDLKSWYTMDAVERYPRGKLLQAAHDYIGELPWIQKCMGFWAGIVVPELIGVFLYKIVPKKPDIPEYHWIIVGPRWPYPDIDESRVDQNEFRNRTYARLPHAYIWTGHPDFAVGDGAPNPAGALDSYVGLIGEWVKAVQSDSDLAKLFPVNVPSGKTAHEYADDIAPLLKKIDEEILPNYAEDLKGLI